MKIDYSLAITVDNQEQVEAILENLMDLSKEDTLDFPLTILASGDNGLEDIQIGNKKEREM
jgi:hypothetical protein